MCLGAQPTLGHSQVGFCNGFCNGGILGYDESFDRNVSMRKYCEELAGSLMFTLTMTIPGFQRMQHSTSVGKVVRREGGCQVHKTQSAMALGRGYIKCSSIRGSCKQVVQRESDRCIYYVEFRSPISEDAGISRGPNPLIDSQSLISKSQVNRWDRAANLACPSDMELLSCLNAFRQF